MPARPRPPSGPPGRSLGRGLQSPRVLGYRNMYIHIYVKIYLYLCIRIYTHIYIYIYVCISLYFVSEFFWFRVAVHQI